MTTWTIKSQTDDPQLALAIVNDQRNKGYNAWIEDENGAAVDEQSLKMNGLLATKRTLSDRLMGPFLDLACFVAGIFVLYLLGLWVGRG